MKLTIYLKVKYRLIYITIKKKLRFIKYVIFENWQYLSTRKLIFSYCLYNIYKGKTSSYI